MNQTEHDAWLAFNNQRTKTEQYFLSSLKDRRDILLAIAGGASAQVLSLQHRTLWAEMCDIAQAGREDIWPALLEHAVTGKGCGFTASKVIEIDNLAPDGLNAKRRLEAVLCLAAKENAVKAILGAKEQLLADRSDELAALSDKLGSLRQSLLASAAPAEKTDDGGIAEAAAELEDAITHPEKYPTVDHFLPAATRLFAPIHRHELVVVAGRPGTGKTIWGLASAWVLAKGTTEDAPVVFVSCEMGKTELLDRIVRMEAGADCIGTHPAERKLYLGTLHKVAGQKNFIVFEHASARKIGWLEARIKLMVETGKRPRMIVVDYLQLLDAPPGTSASNRERQVAELSRRLKLLAKDCKTPIMLLCQLNREVEKHDREPIMSDLRESGAIEQDADRIIFLHKDTKEAAQSESFGTTTKVVAIQAKLRNGKSGVKLPMQLHGPTYRLIPEVGGV